MPWTRYEIGTLILAILLVTGGFMWVGYYHLNPFTTTSEAKFYIYRAHLDGTTLGEPETANHSNGECPGALITDPPNSQEVIREWCVLPGGIRYIDNEPLPKGTTHIPMTDEVRAAIEEKGRS